MASPADPTAADWASPPARSPAAVPRSYPRARLVAVAVATPATAMTTARTASRPPPPLSPRANSGPTRYPAANRKTSNATVRRNGGTVTPSWPTAMPARRDPAAVPRANRPIRRRPTRNPRARARNRATSGWARNTSISASHAGWSTRHDREAGGYPLGNRVGCGRDHSGSRYPRLSMWFTRTRLAVRSARALATVPGPWPRPCSLTAPITSFRVSGCPTARSTARTSTRHCSRPPRFRFPRAVGIGWPAGQTTTRQAKPPAASATRRGPPAPGRVLSSRSRSRAHRSTIMRAGSGTVCPRNGPEQFPLLELLSDHMYRFKRQVWYGQRPTNRACARPGGRTPTPGRPSGPGHRWPSARP